MMRKMLNRKIIGRGAGGVTRALANFYKMSCKMDHSDKLF